MNYLNRLIYTTPLKRLVYVACISSPVFLYNPIRSALLDRSDAVKPDKHIKRLLDEVIRDQNLKHKDYELLVKDVLEFESYPSLIGKSTLIIPKYFNVESLDDLKSSYINSLLKKQFGLELKDKDQWFTDEGKKIISSFLLTDHAKKFLLSKHLNGLHTDSKFGYFFLLLFSIYLPCQFIKWKDDLFKAFTEDLAKLVKENAKLPKHKQMRPGFFKLFFIKYKNSMLALLISGLFLLDLAAYYSIGVKSSRDADALTLSRGLANATTIKAKLTLIDFNYYSGGEEGYRKLIERNRSLNNLFFKGISELDRYKKKIPFDSKGDPLILLSNKVPLSSAYKNLNEWEKNSSY